MESWQWELSLNSSSTSGACSCSEFVELISQRTHDAMITSLLHPNDIRLRRCVHLMITLLLRHIYPLHDVEYSCPEFVKLVSFLNHFICKLWNLQQFTSTLISYIRGVNSSNATDWSLLVRAWRDSTAIALELRIFSTKPLNTIEKMDLNLFLWNVFLIYIDTMQAFTSTHFGQVVHYLHISLCIHICIGELHNIIMSFWCNNDVSKFDKLLLSSTVNALELHLFSAKSREVDWLVQRCRFNNYECCEVASHLTM